MRHIEIGSKEELAHLLTDLQSSHFFRGQTKHYTEGGVFHGFPTSFERHGCIPRRMRRWACYAHDILYTLSTAPKPDVPLELSQALLQHYGWRSFFVDLSASPGVAAWFASHAFAEKDAFVISEDINEVGVTLHYRLASYSPSRQQRGHLYCIARDALQSHGIGVHDLRVIMSELQCRPTRQEAIVVGPLSSRLAADVVTHHIEADCSLLRELALDAGIQHQDDLFPTAGHDILYQHFLREPWVEISAGVFTRSLNLPVYEDPKHRCVQGAFLRPTWVSSDLDAQAKSLPSGRGQAMVIRSPADAMFGFGQPTDTFALPHLRSFLSKHGSIVIEADGLYQFPVFKEYEFIKGVVLTQAGEDMVDISDLLVDLRGSHIVGWGESASRRYSWTGANCLVAAPAKSDCPCNYQLRHARQIETLCCVESEVANMDAVPGVPRTFELAFSK